MSEAKTLGYSIISMTGRYSKLGRKRNARTNNPREIWRPMEREGPDQTNAR